MSQLTMGVYNCTTGIRNTGLPSCPLDLKTIYKSIHVPKGTKLTLTQQLTLKALIQDMINHNNPALRWYPVGIFTDTEDRSEEATYRTSGHGQKSKGRDGQYAWYFMLQNGGWEAHRDRKSFDNKQDDFDVFFIDKDNNGLIGLITGDQDNEFGSIPLELLDVPNFKVNTGGEDSQYSIGYCMADSDDINKRLTMIKFDSNYSLVRNVVGLRNIDMVVHTPMTAGGLIKFRCMNGGTNLASVFSAELADDSVWSAANNSTGGAIAIASVDYNSDDLTFDVQLDPLDPNYPPSADDLIDINIGDITAMRTAGILGYGNASTTRPRA